MMLVVLFAFFSTFCVCSFEERVTYVLENLVELYPLPELVESKDEKISSLMDYVKEPTPEKASQIVAYCQNEYADSDLKIEHIFWSILRAAAENYKRTCSDIVAIKPVKAGDEFEDETTEAQLQARSKKRGFPIFLYAESIEEKAEVFVQNFKVEASLSITLNYVLSPAYKQSGAFAIYIREDVIARWNNQNDSKKWQIALLGAQTKELGEVSLDEIETKIQSENIGILLSIFKQFSEVIRSILADNIDADLDKRTNGALSQLKAFLDNSDTANEGEFVDGFIKCLRPGQVSFGSISDAFNAVLVIGQKPYDNDDSDRQIINYIGKYPFLESESKFFDDINPRKMKRNFFCQYAPNTDYMSSPLTHKDEKSVEHKFYRIKSWKIVHEQKVLAVYLEHSWNQRYSDAKFTATPFAEIFSEVSKNLGSKVNLFKSEVSTPATIADISPFSTSTANSPKLEIKNTIEDQPDVENELRTNSQPSRKHLKTAEHSLSPTNNASDHRKPGGKSQQTQKSPQSDTSKNPNAKGINQKEGSTKMRLWPIILIVLVVPAAGISFFLLYKRSLSQRNQ